MTEADDRIIKKIQALFARGGSDFPAEAASSLSKAHELMEKYSITMSQIERAQGTYADAEFWVGKVMPCEMEYTIPFLTAFFHVRFVIAEPGVESPEGTLTRIFVTGLPHHCRIAGFVNWYLYQQFRFYYQEVYTMGGLRANYSEAEWAILEEPYRRDFYRGVTATLYEKMEISQARVNLEVQEQGLVPVDDGALDALMEERSKKQGIAPCEREPAPHGETYSPILYAAGVEFGKRIHIHTAVEAPANKNESEKPDDKSGEV